MALGRAVVSTPYWHAAELLADECGILVPFNDPSAIGRAINDLLSNEKRRHTMGRNAYRIGRKMVWAHVARLYLKSFERTLKKWRESGAQFRFPPRQKIAPTASRKRSRRHIYSGPSQALRLYGAIHSSFFISRIFGRRVNIKSHCWLLSAVCEPVLYAWWDDHRIACLHAGALAANFRS